MDDIAQKGNTNAKKGRRPPGDQMEDLPGISLQPFFCTEIHLLIESVRKLLTQMISFMA